MGIVPVLFTSHFGAGLGWQIKEVHLNFQFTFWGLQTAAAEKISPAGRAVVDMWERLVSLCDKYIKKEIFA